MHWGVRRYQNPDGTLTSAGKSRYGIVDRAKIANYNLNARTYDKLGNKTLASMNRAAAKNAAQKAEGKAQKREARKELTKARSKYNESFNKFYRTSQFAFTKKQRQKRDYEYADALVKAGTLGVKKAQYKIKKAEIKGDNASVMRGKRALEQAKNTRAYNMKVRDLVKAGNTYKESSVALQDELNAAIRKSNDINKKYVLR